MSACRDPERGTYYVQCCYKDWTNEPKKKAKRGFKTEKEARRWEYEFLKRMEGVPAMLFSGFYEVYAEVTKMRLRRTTRGTKANMTESKILPFLEHKRVNEIAAFDILNGKAELMIMHTGTGLKFGIPNDDSYDTRASFFGGPHPYVAFPLTGRMSQYIATPLIMSLDMEVAFDEDC